MSTETDLQAILQNQEHIIELLDSLAVHNAAADATAGYIISLLQEYAAKLDAAPSVARATVDGKPAAVQTLNANGYSEKQWTTVTHWAWGLTKGGDKVVYFYYYDPESHKPLQWKLKLNLYIAKDQTKAGDFDKIAFANKLKEAGGIDNLSSVPMCSAPPQFDANSPFIGAFACPVRLSYRTKMVEKTIQGEQKTVEAWYFAGDISRAPATEQAAPPSQSTATPDDFNDIPF